MSRRHLERHQRPPWPPHRVAFICTGCGSHPLRVLARLGVLRYDDGQLNVLHREGTDITRPLPAPWSWTYGEGPLPLVVQCKTCHAVATYPGALLLEMLAEVLGKGTRPTADVDICYRRKQ